MFPCFCLFSVTLSDCYSLLRTMTFYGLKCLRKLEILYCHHTKASAGLRDLIHDGKYLYSFAQQNPHVQLIVSMDTGKPPLMIASYIPSVPQQKLMEHIVELSNLPKEDIGKKITYLSNRTGRYIHKKKWKNTETKNFSLQGRWYPGMWNKKISHMAVLETHRHVPSEWDYAHLPHRPYPKRNTQRARWTRRERLMKLRL